MKCNIKAQLQSRVAKDIASTQETVKRLWELLTLLALHREFGFGVKRLKRFANMLKDIYSEFADNATKTDKYDRKHREFTNIDTAIIKTLRELRSAGIDHRNILGDAEELVMIDESGKETHFDELLDKIEGSKL